MAKLGVHGNGKFRIWETLPSALGATQMLANSFRSVSYWLVVLIEEIVMLKS